MSTLTIRTLYDDIQSRLDELSVDSSAVSESRNTLDRVIAGGEATYGVNTGFGKLANKRIDDNDLSTLQRNLLVSHAVGVGDSRTSRNNGHHAGAQGPCPGHGIFWCFGSHIWASVGIFSVRDDPCRTNSR